MSTCEPKCHGYGLGCACNPPRGHRFTDQQATTIVLHGLINDMHHVLGRIAWALTLAALLEGTTAVVAVFHGHWIDAGIAALLAGCLGSLMVEDGAQAAQVPPRHLRGRGDGGWR